MKQIFKFKTENELTEFDRVYHYSGSLDTAWIYGEGTNKWFSIQFCGNRWCFQGIKPKINIVDFYPTDIDEFYQFIQNQLGDSHSEKENEFFKYLNENNIKKIKITN